MKWVLPSCFEALLGSPVEGCWGGVYRGLWACGIWSHKAMLLVRQDAIRRRMVGLQQPCLRDAFSAAGATTCSLRHRLIENSVAYAVGSMQGQVF